MTKRHGPFFLLLLLLLAPPAWAIKEWYDYYAEGMALLRQGRHVQALQSFQEAIKLKPDSELNARPYGMEFVQYLPYHQMGVCYQKAGDFQSAIRMFNIEESKGEVKKSQPLYTELRRLRIEAEKGERARLVQRVREEIEKLEKEAAELASNRRYEEALARLAQALAAAGQLDPTTQNRLTGLREKIRAEQRAQSETADRVRRIDQDLAEARRLLESRPADAIVRFDQVLALDPGNRRAQDGKRDAQDRIRASQHRQALEDAFQEGKGLVDAGRYEESLRPLTTAAADPRNRAARELLDRAQKVVLGLRRERELRQRIDALMAEAERLIAAEKFPEAQVKLEGLLALDPGSTRARERLSLAETKTGEALFARFLPNRPPELVIFEPRQHQMTVEGPSLELQGVASDDHRVVKIEFLSGQRRLAELLARPDPGELSANLRFERIFPLEPGLNEFSVVATDSLGLKRMETLKVTRKLRIYETRAFLPAATAAALGLVGAGFGVQRWRRRRAVRNRFNPYIAGAPVMDDDLFFGRSKLLARILNVLHHNSLMITGERRIGKTTFLYHLKKALEADDSTEYKFFPVFTDLQGASEQDFFHAVMGDVADALAPEPATLRFRADDDHYDGRDFSHDLQRVIEELKTRTPKRVKLALLIDEVDVLNEFSERVNQRLRSIFMKTFSESLVAIMSGVGIRRTWQSEGSPWYNFFDEVELAAFTREDAQALIKTPVEGIFRYEPEAVQRILEWSELKPYVIQRFCIYAVNRIIEERRTVVTAADVLAVREAVQMEGREPEQPAPELRRQASA